MLLFFNQVTSQDKEAEIFFKDGTSLHGFGMIYKNNKIKFKLFLDDEPDIWTHLMVKGIVFYDYNHGGMYEYVVLKPGGSPQLLEVLSEGEVTLYANVLSINYYEHVDLDINVNDHGFNTFPVSIKKKKYTTVDLYVKRESEKYPTVLNGRFRNTSQKYFSDCKEVLEKLQTGEFRKTNANELVDYYNDFCF
ncbi:hypothetical protein AB832_04040 [Flavobacteriaceae bacterium (ex Bugula neritina AB1)]|nr:hypothetical protein AB832_04040 [Flavobacteriaceae bacterium (ex Bugula neritina AB1)]